MSTNITQRLFAWSVAVSVHVAIGWAFLSSSDPGTPGIAEATPSSVIQLQLYSPPGEALSTPVQETVPTPALSTGPADATEPTIAGASTAPTDVEPSSATPASQPPSAAARATAASDTAYLAYRNRLDAHLARYRIYPNAARTARQQGVVRVQFVMNSNGRVETAWVAESSGYEHLDQEAVDAITRAQPLPPFPSHWGQELSIVIPIEFHLE